MRQDLYAAPVVLPVPRSTVPAEREQPPGRPQHAMEPAAYAPGAAREQYQRDGVLRDQGPVDADDRQPVPVALPVALARRLGSAVRRPPEPAARPRRCPAGSRAASRSPRCSRWTRTAPGTRVPAATAPGGPRQVIPGAPGGPAAIARPAGPAGHARPQREPRDRASRAAGAPPAPHSALGPIGPGQQPPAMNSQSPAPGGAGHRCAFRPHRPRRSRRLPGAPSLARPWRTRSSRRTTRGRRSVNPWQGTLRRSGWRRCSRESRGCPRILRRGCFRARLCPSTSCCMTRSGTHCGAASGTLWSALVANRDLTVI